MDFSQLQRTWDAFGRLDPFWAILTDPGRRGNRWDPAEFFATGRDEVAALVQRAIRLGVPGRWGTALDFGCGAGRLTQALADHVDQVVGIDVAPSMIDLARRHNAHGPRCRFEVNDRPDLSRFGDAAFDVVYAGRVLQHMEPGYAEGYIREFVRVLAPGGYLAFDVPSELGFFGADVSAEGRPLSTFRASIHPIDAPRQLSPGERREVVIEVRNAGDGTWEGMQLNAGNHWALGGAIVVRDDGRVGMAQPCGPGESRRVALMVTAPAQPGVYGLQFDVVSEGVAWFADLGSEVAEIEVNVGNAVKRAPEPSSVAVHQEPQMEMHPVRRARVEESLRAAGARLLDVQRVLHCGPAWLAFRYDCSR